MGGPTLESEDTEHYLRCDVGSVVLFLREALARVLCCYEVVMRATFSIDLQTDAALRRVSERLNESKSAIVRRAIIEFEARCDRLSEHERQHQLSVLARLKTLSKTGSQKAVDQELAQLREDRRSGRATD